MSDRGLRNLVISSALILFTSVSGAQDFVPGEVIVKLKGKSSSVSASQFMGKVQGKMALKNSVQALNIHRFSLKANSDVLATVKDLKADPAVEYAEPNYIFRKLQDSLESGQSVTMDEINAQANPGDTFTQNYANVGVDQAWGQLSTLAQVSEKPIVAVIDTGVDYNHGVFQESGAIWVNSGEIANNGIDDDGNGYVDDVHGYNFVSKTGSPMDDGQHGTHVAGIILGVGQDIFAGTREAAKVRIMALKFLAADGSGTTADAVSAIYYAVRNGAQVINNSWGGPNYSQSLHDALTYAYSQHVLLVAAAGNYGQNNDSTPMYPASYPVPGQITVAATNDNDVLASFSNYASTSVHLAAPGVSVLSTIPSNNFKFMSGTSMATPFVAGVGALVLREAPNMTGFQIKNLLLNSASVITGLEGKVSSGARVDVYDSIMAARSQASVASFQPDYKAENRSVASTEESSSSSPGGCGLVSTALLSGAGKGGSSKGSAGPNALMVVVFALLPVLVWQIVRARLKPQRRRKYDRFLMNSTVRVNVSGRELIGHMRTISEGGLSFEANTMLEKGGVVTMQIQSPDGKETVSVQGHIVWSEENKSYGVQFDEARESTVSRIRNWTQRLVRVANY